MWPIIKFKRNENLEIKKDIDLDQDRLIEHGEQIGEIYKANKKVNVKRLLLNRLDDNFKRN